MIETTKKTLEDYLKHSERKFHGKIVFTCPPSINISTRRQFDIKDLNGEYPDELPEFSNDNYAKEVSYFKKNASSRQVNRVEFIIDNNQIHEVKEYWDEQIIEEFNSNLPKSKKGKIKAWYDIIE